MKILALETSAKAVSAALSEDGRILASGYQDTDPQPHIDAHCGASVPQHRIDHG